MTNTIQRFEDYLLTCRQRSPRTADRYRSVLQRFHRFVGGERGVRSADRGQVESFLQQYVTEVVHSNESERRRIRATRWNNSLSALRSYYRFLMRERQVKVNPTDLVDRVRAAVREAEPPTLAEVRRMVAQLDGQAAFLRARNRLILLVLYHCALRVTEVMSIDLVQLDEAQRRFANVRRKGGKWITAPYNTVVAKALAEYLPLRSQMASSYQTALFVSTLGKPLGIRSVQKMLHRAARMAGIDKRVTPHLLRHASVTQLVAEGAHISVIQGICGHSSVSTTQRYIHVDKRQRQDALELLANRWLNTGTFEGNPG